MADDTEELQDNDVPVIDTGTEEEEVPAEQQQFAPVTTTATAPTPPPAALSAAAAPEAMPTQSPFVPFQISRRDPVTGQVTSVSGYGARATPPDPNAAFWNRLRERTANLPLAQTEAAVSAAIRFQGQRQYQQDLASGMDPAKALARSAPLMFSTPRPSGSLGQAAQLIRATSSPARRFHDVGGVLYRENADGTVTRVTGPAAPRYHTAGGVLYRETPTGLQAMTAPTTKTDPYEMAEYRNVLSEISAAQKALDKMAVDDPEAQPLRDRIRFLTAEKQRLRRPTPTRTPTVTTGRVRVRRPDGKTGSIPANRLQEALDAGWTQIR